MTKHPMTKEARMTNDKALRALRFVSWDPSYFGLRHSFVIGYFVIRHFLSPQRLDPDSKGLRTPRNSNTHKPYALACVSSLA